MFADDSHPAAAPMPATRSRYRKHILIVVSAIALALAFVTLRNNAWASDKLWSNVAAGTGQESAGVSADVLEEHIAPVEGAIDDLQPVQEPDAALTEEPDDTAVVKSSLDKGLDYRELSSLTTSHLKYATIYFAGRGITNPSIIPHPTQWSAYILLGQRDQHLDKHLREELLVCSVGFYKNAYICEDDGYETVNVTAAMYGKCPVRLDKYNQQLGPHRLSLFHGRDAPYVLYSSQSRATCLSNWVHNARSLLDAFHLDLLIGDQAYTGSTEISRPGRMNDEEKSFLFWDREGQVYAHYNFWPRGFGALDANGNVKQDLSVLSREKDQACAERLMPKIVPPHETLSAGTNTLSVTLCRRADPLCQAESSNTFLMEIFHHEYDYDYHVVVEPYIILYQEHMPFGIRAIGTRPFWIRGREYKKDERLKGKHTERFRINTMSWKPHTSKYHGYLDDVVLLGISIEDVKGGIMDVTAADLLQDLAFC